MCCMGCGSIVCVCHSPFVRMGSSGTNDSPPVPPYVIPFDGRSPKARRIANLESRCTCLDVYLKSAVQRIEVLESRIAGIEERHIKLLDCLIKQVT